jgi:replicative DNA helicase
MDTAQTLTLPAAPPAAPEAEEAVLGCILVDGEALKEIEFLDGQDFYVERNRWIFVVAQDLRRAGMHVDYLTVMAELERRGVLREAGGPARLTRLIGQHVTTLHIESYAKIIKAKAARRRMLAIASSLAQAALDEQADDNAAVSAAIDSLSRARAGSKGALHISNYLSKIYDEVMEAHANPRDLIGYTTGFTDWDRITGGLVPGTTLRLVGDPGMGKSLLMMQILYNTAEKGNPCVLYELEMKGTQPVRRLLSWKAQITTAALRTGKITDEEVNQFTAALEMLADKSVYISDEPRMTTAEIRADLVRLKEYHGVTVAAIDYEALIDGPGATENERRSRVSDEVHAIAKDLDLAIISVGDMTKEGIKGETDGQGAAAGTAHELHNADEIVRMKLKRGTTNVVGLTWVKLREPSGAGNYLELIRSPKGFPAFEQITKKSQ